MSLRVSVRVRGWKLLGVLANLAGRGERYQQCWREVLVLNPSERGARGAIGISLFEAGEPLAALEYLRAETVVSPESASAWFNLAFVTQDQGLTDESLAAFDKAIERDPRLDRAYYGKAIALIGRGQVSEAIPLLLRNTELQPMSPYGWYQLAHAYHRLGQPERVARVIAKLRGFEPKVARLLERETGAAGSPT